MTLMPTKICIQFIVLILFSLSPGLVSVLVMGSGLLRTEQPVSRLQVRHPVVSVSPLRAVPAPVKPLRSVSVSPLRAVTVPVKPLRSVHQTLKRSCASVILIINYLSLRFCDSGRPGTFQLFYKQEAVGEGGTLYLGRDWQGSAWFQMQSRAEMDLYRGAGYSYSHYNSRKDGETVFRCGPFICLMAESAIKYH